MACLQWQLPGPALILRALSLAVALALGGCEPSGEPAGAPVQTPITAVPAAATASSGFDFYVLSLTWSPTFCASEGTDAPNSQCGADRDFAFLVHGLWPQFDRGWPEFCDSSEPERVPEALARTIRDIMPSPGLVRHQWRKHGTCTGLSQANYVAAIREAWEAITIPPAYRAASRPSRSDPDDVEADFLTANKGLPAGGIAVTCDGGRLDEVRICLSKDLSFRSCPEVDRKSCRASSISLPAAP